MERETDAPALYFRRNYDGRVSGASFKDRAKTITHDHSGRAFSTVPQEHVEMAFWGLVRNAGGGQEVVDHDKGPWGGTKGEARASLQRSPG